MVTVLVHRGETSMQNEETKRDTILFSKYIFSGIFSFTHLYTQHICKPGGRPIRTCKHVPSIILMAMPCFKIQLQKGQFKRYVLLYGQCVVSPKDQGLAESGHMLKQP